MRSGDVWFFDRIAPVYQHAMPAATSSELIAGLQRAERPVVRVLDLGGGTGRAIDAILDQDLDPLVLDASRGMLARTTTPVARIQASATALPFPAASVDAILVVDAFHHFPEHSTVLREIGRVLRPGGVVVIRDFDPTTVRGRLVAGVERLVGMRSRFLAADGLAASLSAVNLRPEIIDGGFAYTVVARKPLAAESITAEGSGRTSNGS